MSKEVKLPELGENVESAQVLTVLVKPGDAVGKDQPVIEVETEKAVIEVPVPFNGTVLSLAAEVGESVKVGDVLAVFGTADEAAAAGEQSPAQSPDNDEAAASEAAESPAAAAQAKPGAKAVTAPVIGGLLLRAMPAVRRLAAEHEIDISQIDGTGRNDEMDVRMEVETPGMGVQHGNRAGLAA